MFYLIGLGLGDLKDISVKGLEIVRQCSKVYLEYYTSILNISIPDMSLNNKNHYEQKYICGFRKLSYNFKEFPIEKIKEEFYGKKLIITERSMIEDRPEDIYRNSKSEDIALLVVGDPFSATTHTDLVLRAKNDGYVCKVIHNTSIFNAIACTGLQLYRFGETVSIPFFSSITPNLENLPQTFYEKIVSNYTRDLHTLCLLDIRVKEPTLESLMRGKNLEYEPAKFMTVNEAAQQLITIAELRQSRGQSTEICESTKCVGVARIGSDDQQLCFNTLQKMTEIDFGKPLHSLVVLSPNLHCIEQEFLAEFLRN